MAQNTGGSIIDATGTRLPNWFLGGVLAAIIGIGVAAQQGVTGQLTALTNDVRRANESISAIQVSVKSLEDRTRRIEDTQDRTGRP